MSGIRFAGDLPPLLVAAAALIAALLVITLYFRESRQLALPYSYVLPALRASAVVLVILILAGPVWHRRQVIGQLGQVMFAIDTSESMQTSDSSQSPKQPSRMDRAIRLLTGHDEHPGWLDQLATTHEVAVVAFAEDPPRLLWTSRDGDPAPSSFEVVADGQGTNLSAPLSVMKAMVDRTDPIENAAADQGQRAAVVLMSDGRHNVGSSAVDAAADLAIGRAAVHAIGIGSQDEPVDVGIVKIDRPESVAADAKLAGSITIRRGGGVDGAINLRIEAVGKTVWQQTVDVAKTNVNADGLASGAEESASGTAAGGEQNQTLRDDTAPGEQIVPFELDVGPIVESLSELVPRGVRRSLVVLDLRAVVDPIDGDANPENNVTAFRVAATTRDRKVLVLDGSSRWETRYLRNLFSRDPAWQIDTVLYGPGTDRRRVPRGEGSGRLPGTRESWAKYDAVILGEIPTSQWTEEDSFLLREFVTRGGGLIVIDGRYERVSELTGGKLSDLIPVAHVADSDSSFEIEAIRPAPVAIEQPVLDLWGDKERLIELWRQLPPPIEAAHVRAQEGAEVWANLVSPRGRQMPWLVTRLYGAGRVVYLSSDQTWRWRYKVADRFHARFWNQLLAAVMQPPYSASDDYVALGTDKLEYNPRQSPVIRARLQDSDGNPVGDATVDALLIRDDRVVTTVPLAVDDPARGTYLGQAEPLPPGAYQVRIRASGFDAAALQASSPIWVNRQQTGEQERIALDQNTLRQIAEAGGGRYVHESSADSILASLAPLSSGTVIESDILLWQSYYWFFAVLLLLAAEWWLRKRAGLV